MKSVLFLISGFLIAQTATAQVSNPQVSTARSARMKISTKSFYAALPATPSKNAKSSNSTDEKPANPLQAIQFVQSKAEFLPTAQPALDQLLVFMRDKPTVEIELGGHTDNQGDFDQNVLLSKQRVDLVKAYLVKNGIVAKRITTRGYGPTRPVASNSSEATRQLNRRVEMLVMKQ